MDVLLEDLRPERPPRYDEDSFVLHHPEERSAILLIRHHDNVIEVETYAFRENPERVHGPALWFGGHKLHASDPDLLTKVHQEVGGWKGSPIGWANLAVREMATRLELDLVLYIVSPGGSADRP